MPNEAMFRKGDLGTALVVEVVDEAGAVVDVSGATAKKIFLTKPGGTVLTKDAVFDTDGTDGLIKHLTVAGDFDTVGTYQIEGRVTLSATEEWSTEIGVFRVYPTLA